MFGDIKDRTRDDPAKPAVLIKALEAITALLDQVHVPVIVPSDNDERDRYIYEQYLAGVPLKKIVNAVNARAGCVELGSDDAVRKAMIRYCNKHRLQIPSRKLRRNRQD